MTVSEVAERVQERLEPVRRLVTRRRETPVERVKGAVEDASERLAEQARGGKEAAAGIAERASEGTRAATERVGEFVTERFGSETAGVWGARVALLGAGFVLGFVLGWLLRAGRGGEDSADALPEGLSQSPAGMPRGSNLESEAAPWR